MASTKESTTTPRSKKPRLNSPRSQERRKKARLTAAKQKARKAALKVAEEVALEVFEHKVQKVQAEVQKKLPVDDGVIWFPDWDPTKTLEENKERDFNSPGIQSRALASDVFEILVAGGRGSGKSDYLLMDCLSQVSHKAFRGLVIRNTMDELRELISRAQDLYPRLVNGKVKYLKQEKIFQFDVGSRIEFGFLDSMEDVERYKGQQYTWLGIDELTKIPHEEMYEKLIASVRTTGEGLKTYVRATTNPDGAGQGWVKKRFVDKGKPEEVIVIEPKGIPDDVLPFIDRRQLTRQWFTSRPEDNKVLLHNDPAYIARLYSIDNELQRKQWALGEWGAAEGLAFSEFQPELHVVKPFHVGEEWYKMRACDYGYGSMAVCLWMAIDDDDNIYVYRELVGQKILGSEFARLIHELEKGELISSGILDSKVWSTTGSTAESIADQMTMTLRNLYNRCLWTPAGNAAKGSRAEGKQLVHDYLQTQPVTKKPKLFIFDTCRELIKELSSLMIDKNNPEDIDQSNKSKLPDHAYDALRYALMSRPRSANNRHIANYNKSYRSTAPIVVSSSFGY